VATILDVAARAGVGVGTVSRVLNESSAVSATTRQLVLTAIEELGYQPSSLARNLSLGRSSSVFVVAPILTSPAVTTRLRGVLEALSLTGLDPILLEVANEEQSRDRFRRIAERGRAEGAVVIDLRPSPAESAVLLRAGTRCVFVGQDVEGWPSAWADEAHGTRIATEHLIGLGHRRIAYVGEPESIAASRRRLRGFNSAVTAADFETDGALVISRADSEAAVGGILDAGRPPSAVVAGSDWRAITVLAEARRRGMRVPDDLSVIGFDGSDLARHIGLTTIGQQLAESGRWAVESLLALIAGSEAVPRHRLRLDLIEGETTGPCGT
jgi:DNA-binding LacI/PurR family transcriptional regulator